MKKRAVKTFSLLLCGVMGLSVTSAFSGCGSKEKKDAVVIMTEELSGLFNPFYATSGADMDVVGMTQIGMLTTNADGDPIAGPHESTVVEDFEYVINGEGEDAETVYTFVIKNGLTFSDGHPLTMNDVMFNIYEYLDPVYTGSSTMYSIKIKGLSEYRLQSTDESGSSLIADTAADYADIRILELINLYRTCGLIDGSQDSYSMDYNQVMAAIDTWPVSEGYQMTVATETQRETLTLDDYRKMLKADYDLTLKTFREELESDFKAAKESYDLTVEPYKDHKDKFEDEIFKFFFYEHYINPIYAEDEKGKEILTKIEGWHNNELQLVNTFKTPEAAINKVYNDNVKTNLVDVLTGWATADTLKTKYAAQATDVLLHEQLDGEGLLYPNIEGIVSLGHNTQETTVTVNDKVYDVAREYNSDGTPKSGNDVLQITVEGTDPKAIYSFAFTVAPAHYYSADEDHPNGRTINIVENQFGVEWASSDFQNNAIQSQRHQEVPLGAGPFAATNYDNDDTKYVSGDEFWASNAVYYKKNTEFMFTVKTEKLRMQVISAANAIDNLKNGSVDYITPQYTKTNAQELKAMKATGNFNFLHAEQLGYGYIGINAGKVPDLEIRKAIMAAMDVNLALDYYEGGTCSTINWPMSQVSWAYPWEDKKTKTEKYNGHDYANWEDEGDETTLAKGKIRALMEELGVSEGDPRLKIEFTIAGASITEHPTYKVFKKAQTILNEMGWKVSLTADSQALTKLATGSLAVWAAAWGSTVDPDMYQVYHMNSTATSVYSWGYREIKADQDTYWREYEIIKNLSAKIDEARMYMDQEDRTPLYEDAMRLVLDLAVEMPVYQRETVYAYNTKTIKGLKETVNSYSTPLERIWELELIQED